MAENNVFLNRAYQLNFSMEVLREDEECASATALLAVHTAIALNDAVLLRLIGKRPKGLDHQRAADATEEACRAMRLDDSGLKHLRALLSKKTQVSYGDIATTHVLSTSLAVASKKFQTWAYAILAPRREA